MQAPTLSSCAGSNCRRMPELGSSPPAKLRQAQRSCGSSSGRHLQPGAHALQLRHMQLRRPSAIAGCTHSDVCQRGAARNRTLGCLMVAMLLLPACRCPKEPSVLGEQRCAHSRQCTRQQATGQKQRQVCRLVVLTAAGLAGLYGWFCWASYQLRHARRAQKSACVALSPCCLLSCLPQPTLPACMGKAINTAACTQPLGSVY